MKDSIVITNILGSFATNCYTVANQETRDAVIIDPAARADFLIDLIKKEKFNLKAVLLTHGHIDHIGALTGLREAYPELVVYACEDEKEVLESSVYNLSSMFGHATEEKADIYLEDGQEIELIGKKIKCIHVPGHTKGGMCYYFEEDKKLFSGDTLFAFSIGRSDFPTGDADALIDNIEKKLFTLPEEVIVYPGHNDRTTIKREKNGNPYF